MGLGFLGTPPLSLSLSLSLVLNPETGGLFFFTGENFA
jgi:hypothetical protein